MSEMRAIKRLLKYINVNAMDSLVHEGNQIVGWQKTPEFLNLIDAAQKELDTRPAPSGVVDVEKLIAYIKDEIDYFKSHDLNGVSKMALDNVILEVKSGRLNPEAMVSRSVTVGQET